MAGSRAVTLLVLVLWAAPASALDRGGAIDAAKREMKSRCKSEAPCTFSAAKAEKNTWQVRVDYPGGHAILIFNQTGKVIGRVEGK